MGSILVLSAVLVIIACIVIMDSDDSSAEIASGSCGTNVTWVLEDSGALTVSGTGRMDDYTDPDQQPWGSYRECISSITISEGVTSVGAYAFFTCGHATSLTISSSVTSIGDESFSYTTEIKSVMLPNGLTAIGNSAFKESGLTSVNIPNGVTVIGNMTFRYCIGLTSAYVPDSVTKIESEGFLGCINLREIYLSDRLAEVAADSFTDVDLYDSDGMTLMVMDAAHLKGQLFIESGGKAVRFATDLTSEGDVCFKTSDTESATITADDITYLKKRALSNPNLKMRFAVKDGLEASIDASIIDSLVVSDITMTIVPVDKSTLDESVKELVGDSPVYNISFGDYKEFAKGKVTVTVPFSASPEKIEKAWVQFIKDDKAAGTAECIYGDGKVTFDTDTLTMFCVDHREPSGGESSPIWIPVVAVIGIVAAAIGVFLFLRKKSI